MGVVMVRTNSRRNSLIFVVVLSLVIIVGATLAWFGAMYREEQQITIGTVGLDYNIITPDLENVVTGDTLATEVSLSTKADVRPSYARVHIEFVSLNDTLSEEDKKSLLALNFDPVTFYDGDPNYTWDRQDDGFYYLVDSNGMPIILDDANETYIFCEDIIFPNLSKFHVADITPALNLSLRVYIQAIQSENLPMDPVTLADVRSLFEETIEPDEPIGYLVAFETNGGTIVSAEYVDPNGGLIAEPTSIKPGQIIDYWATDIELNNPFNFSSTVSQNMTLYAKWKAESIIIQTPDGTELDEITASDGLYLEDIITSNPSLAIYNFYTNEELTEGVALDEHISVGTDLFVEEYTQDLVVTPVSGSSPVAYAIGDGTNVAYSGTDTNIILPQYYYDGTSVYPVTTINNGAFAGSMVTSDPNVNSDSVESIKISRNITSEIVNMATGGGGIIGLPNLKYLMVDKKNLVYTSVNASDENINAIIDKSNTLVLGCLNTVIPNGVTAIGAGAFMASGITELEIPNSVVEVGYNAFSGCMNLENVVIGNGVETISLGAFYFCSNLISLTIGENVSSLGTYAFAECTSLTNINFNAIALELNIEESENIFLNAGASSQGIDLMVGAKVTKIPAYLFIDMNGSINLKSVAFENGSVCTSIDNFAFVGCANLASVELPNSLQNIGAYAFLGCSSLSDIEIPANVNSIGDAAFYTCSSITSVNIPEGVTTLSGSVFYGCNSLTEVNLPTTLQTIGTRTFSGCSNLSSIILPSNLVSIGSWAFSDTGLVSITIPSNVSSIGQGAFSGCYKLAQVINQSSSFTIVKGSTDNGEVGNYAIEVVNAGASATGVFDDNNSYWIFSYGGYNYLLGLKDASISVINDLTNIHVVNGYAFYHNSTITNVVLPDSVVSIGDLAFYNCTNLTSITLNDGLQSIGQSAFYGCEGLNSVNISSIDMWLNIDFSLSTSNPLYFADNLYLNGDLVTEVTIPSTITTIKSYAFYGYTKLQHVNINSNVTNIESNTFYNCTNLISATIPNSAYITTGAFSGCTKAYFLCEDLSGKNIFVSSHSNLDASKVLYKTTDAVSGTWTVVDGTNNTIESCVSGSTTYYRLVSDPSTYYKA